MAMRDRFLTAAAGVTVALLGCASPAHADSPPCSTDQFPADRAAFYTGLAFSPTSAEDVRIPAEVPEGRAVHVEPYIGFADALAGAPVGVSVVAVSGKPLVHPFSRRFPVPASGDVDGAFPPVTLQLELADGPARILLDFDYEYVAGAGSGVCRATIVSKPITPVAGKVTLDSRPAKIDIGDTEHVEGVELALDLSKCGSKTVSVEATVAGTTLRLASRSCRLSGSRSNAAGLRMTASPAEDGRALVDVWVRRNAVFTRAVTYRVTYGSKAVRSGSFRARSRHHRGRPGHRIYDSDFDNYVNVCINDNYKTYADHGRLYCYVPGDPSYYYQRVDRVR